MIKKKILIIDDSAIARKIIERCFKMCCPKETNIFFAENGIEALDILKQHIFDLIISDIRMPEMDGIELLDRVKNIPLLKNIPYIMVTSMEENSLNQSLYKKGVNSVIKKPLSAPKFNEVLTALKFV